jgi:hypothetical protein
MEKGRRLKPRVLRELRDVRDDLDLDLDGSAEEATAVVRVASEHAARLWLSRSSVGARHERGIMAELELISADI